ncbi:hypothetical protein FHX42_003367 [Saccharopolyspora lacisalsi]|uniref:Uncharacterized protein n=1 Tax=Halosaccharopolyspora lacisalsi TaxID=1000566 RepID=A0A839E3P4_9PSEU|nr:hypothetical protein [Halosaccharopolyspora lacisalsi]MBA8826001.1 hypothetical protein [Halosaccharopolyspora lacisalsi]
MADRTVTDSRPLRETVEHLLVRLLTSTGDHRPDTSPSPPAQLRAVLVAAEDHGCDRNDRARAAAITALERWTVADLSGARSSLIRAHWLLTDTARANAAGGRHRPVRAVP